MDNIKIRSSRRVYLIVISTYIYSFINDAAVFWSSPILPKLRQTDPEINPFGRKLTADEISWLGSLLSLGNMVGLIPYAFFCYKFGRKHTLISLAFVHMVAFLLYTTDSLKCFYFGRFLNGIASGAGYIIFPVYIAEICKDSDRGFLVVSRQIFSSCGMLFSYAAGSYLSIFWFNIILCIFPIAFIISFGLLATESPYYYVMKNDLGTARKVFVELTSVDNQETDEDVDEIRKAFEMTETKNLTETLANKPVQKATIIVYTMFIFQHLTGYMPFTTYTELILRDAKDIDPKHGPIVMAVIFLIGSTISTLVIDRKGRKLLLYISLTSVIIIEIVFSSYFFYFKNLHFLPIFCLTAFFLAFNLGLSFLPQIICAEILPLSIKFKIASTAGVFGCGTAFLLTKYFFQFEKSIGFGWMILGFAFCSAIFLVIITVFLPETKGRSFRQIQSMLEVNIEMEPLQEH